MPLTNAACLNAKPNDRSYKKADGGGLYLEVMPTGSKYWRLRYRFAGKDKRMALGVYPAVSLAEARDKREKARKLLADSIDPGVAKQERKLLATLNAATTFELVAREWHEHRRDGWTLAHAQDVLHRLELDVFPQIGNRPIADLTSPQLLACLRKIEDRGAMEVARRTRQICSQLLNYAIVTGRTERNPAEALKGAMKPFKRGHFAAFDADALPEFLRILERNNGRLYFQTRAAISLLMLTFVRTSELIGAQWTEFNFESHQWVIPAERMKMRKTHIVPLSAQATMWLRELHKLTGRSVWLFPSRSDPHDHMSNNTILMALKRLGYGGRMTGHGFRALAMSTIKEELGYRHEVVDRQLAHAPRNKVDAAYDRAMFLTDRRKMMQDWADYLDKLTHIDNAGHRRTLQEAA